MRRRAVFFVAIALCALVANTFQPALAQQPRKVFRIGILSPAASPSTKLFNAFREGLHDRGYVDGRNITIEYRLAAGDINRLPAMANELVRLPVDIIVADGSKSAQIAHEATQTIPIIGVAFGDPVAAGLVSSFEHPGGNVTGFVGLGLALSGKRQQLLKEAWPSISRVAALWNPAQPISVRRATEDAARALGLQLNIIEIATPDEIRTGVNAATASGADALLVLPNAMFWNERARIVAALTRQKSTLFQWLAVPL
jgi:putative ABC transport system substrate-binding protein